jgi:hypothetical protein
VSTLKTRKPAEPRGLVLHLSLEASEKLRELGALAGHTKEALEIRLSAWVEANLGQFKGELANEARASIAMLLAEGKELARE